MTAVEALELSRRVDISYFHKEIQTAAEAGCTKLYLYIPIPYEALSTLRMDGYVITESDGISPEYCISWEHADKK
jgi:hypothetical protein